MAVQIPIFGGGQIVGGQGVRPTTSDWGPKDISQDVKGLASLYKIFQDSEQQAYGKSKQRQAGERYREAGRLMEPGGPYAPQGPQAPGSGPGTGYNVGGRAPSFTALPNAGVSADFKPLFENGEQQYGLPPGTLGSLAFLESKFNPNAKNPNSSAGGLFQFIDKTAKGYGLTDKFDPIASTDAAGRLARDNSAMLQRVLGRMPTVGEIYLAHQQGGPGAVKLLSNPNARAVDIVGEQAVRLNGGNPDMTAGEFAAQWTRRADAAHRNLYPQQQPAANPAAQPAVTPGPGGNQPVLDASGRQMTFEEQVAAAKAAGLPPPVMPSAANPNPQAQPQPQPNPTPATGSSQPLFPAPGNTPVPPNQAQGPQQPYQVAGGWQPPPTQSAQTMAPGGAGGVAGPTGGMQMPPGTNDPGPPVVQAQPPQPAPFVPGGPAPGPGIGVNPDGSRDTTGPNGETIGPNPPPGRQPPPATPAATPAPAVQTAGPGSIGASIPPAVISRLGISPDAMARATPLLMDALGLAIQAGDPGMVQAISGSINSISAASTRAGQTPFKLVPDGRGGFMRMNEQTGEYSRVEGNPASATGDDVILKPKGDEEARAREGLPDDGRYWRIKTDDKGVKHKEPLDDKDSKSFERTNQLATGLEGNETFKTYRKMTDAVEQLKAAFGQGNAAGDLNGIIQVFKVIDPTSTVSATESGQVTGVGGLDAWVQSWANKIKASNGLLTPQLRAEFMNSARDQLQARGKQAMDLYNGTRNRAKGEGLSEDAATNYFKPIDMSAPRYTKDDFKHKDTAGNPIDEKDVPAQPVLGSTPGAAYSVADEKAGDALPAGYWYVTKDGQYGQSDGSRAKPGAR